MEQDVTLSRLQVAHTQIQCTTSVGVGFDLPVTVTQGNNGMQLCVHLEMLKGGAGLSTSSNLLSFTHPKIVPGTLSRVGDSQLGGDILATSTAQNPGDVVVFDVRYGAKFSRECAELL